MFFESGMYFKAYYQFYGSRPENITVLQGQVLLLGYFNLNNLRNKVTDLRIVFKDLSLDYFVLNETKWDESFPNAQLTLDGYEISSRKNRDKYGGGLIEFVKNGFICKTIPDYTSDIIECICSEFTISKSK